MVQISSGGLSVGSTLITYDSAVGGDHHSTTAYEVESGGWRSMVPGDEDAWLQVFDWINQFDGILDQNSPEELRVFVYDGSNPDCMSPSG